MTHKLAACLAFMLLASAAIGQTPAPPPASPNVETIYSDAQRGADETLSRRTVQGVLAPADATEGQYARWKTPVCFNVYGLTPVTKYLIEKRMKDVAQKVGAPLDRRDDCPPTVLIAFTPDQNGTLQSIAKVRPWLVPGLGMIRSRTRETLPIQAWYSIALTGKSGQPILVYDGYDEEPRTIASTEMTRLSTGIESEIMAATIVVDSKAIMGMPLETLADHFAMMSLAQARATNRCRDFETIANLMTKDCDAAHTAKTMTEGDIALLIGLYATSDDRMQVIQKQRIIGGMRRSLEAQSTGRVAPRR